MLILCRYEIQRPLDVCDDGAELAAQSSSLCGTIEVPAAGPRLLLSDLASAWPFAPAHWHFRAELNPPGEPHVFFDLADGPSTPVPLLADGTASVRALPLDALGGDAPAPPRGEAWAWSQEEFAAFRASRRAAVAADAADGDEDALDSPSHDFGDGPSAATARWPSSDALSKASERAAAGAAAAASAAGAAAAGAVTAATDFMRGMFKRA